MKRNINYVDLRNVPSDKKEKSKKKRKIQVILFFAVLGLGMIISLIIPLRPTVSLIEKRELSRFPVFSFSALADGSYFRGIDTWFSDTFPFREGLITANSKLNLWYGFGSKVTNLENKGDDIPDTPLSTTEEAETTAQAVTQKEEQATTEKSTQNIQPKKTETMGGILVAGRAGYEYYNFVQSYADRYIGIVNSTAKKLKGIATVYDVLVPTSIDVTLDDATRSSVSSSDQKKAINYIYSSMNKLVKTVDMIDTLREHNSEYIYFRTDHHWTGLGAYYGYTCFAQVKGIKPVNIKLFEKVSYGVFLGSFYTDTGKNSKLKKGADELIAYQPNYDTTLKFRDFSGKTYTWPLINDVSNYNEAYKYSAFAAGDYPYTVIKNESMKKGSCIVIKESFGNAMIPYLAGNYRKIYVVDYRYWNGKISTLAKEKKVDDVIFINNMSATRNGNLIDDLDKICK